MDEILQPEQILGRVIEQAVINAEKGGGPFAACIVRNGEIIAWGRNCVVVSHDPTAHAEVIAIREGAAALQNHILEGCILYSSCEPCPMCLAAIHWARIEKVIFAATRLDAEAAGFDDSLLYRAFQSGTSYVHLQHLQIDTSTEPFVVWKNNPQRTPY